MARLVTFAALALVLATLSRAQGMMDGAYCPTAASPSAVSDMAVLVNNGYMTVLEHLGTDAYNNCGRLLRYTTDATGNVTLNELRGSGDCSSSYRLLISSMMYENMTQTITAVMTYDSTSTVYNVSLSTASCATQTASTQQLNTGKYCGAWQDSIVAYGKGMLWVTSTCVYSGKYYISGGFNQSTNGFSFTGYQSYVSTSYCGAGGSSGAGWPNTNYVNYWPATGELSVVYTTPRTISLFSTANCLATTPTLEMPINTSYCINAPGNPNFNGGSLVRVNSTSYFLTLPNANFYPSTTTCVFTGNVMSQGSSLGLTVSSYCSSTQQIVYAKLMPDMSIMLIDQLSNYFWATPCPQTGVPNGAYCGGWNARMLVANATFQLWTDSYVNDGMMNTMMPTQTSMYFAGQFIPQADNSSLINTNYLYKSTYYSQILSVNVMGSTVYVVVQRTSGDNGIEGYAFQTDFCATSGVMGNGTNASWVVAPTAGVPAAWLPDTMTCATLAGANLNLQSSMGTVSWIWNNSWVGGVCGYVGYASHRMGQVSYRVLFQSCSSGTAALSAGTTIWRNVVFNNGSLTYVLSNSTANATVMTGSCLMATNNSLPESHYCTNSGKTQLWVNGSNVLYVDSSAPCMVLLQVQSVGMDGTVQLQRQSGLYCPTVFTSSTYSPTVQMLPGGDLYMLTAYGSYYSSTGSIWSSAVCGMNYTQQQLTSVGTYCGKFADGSKLSLVVEPVFQTLTAVLEVAGSTNVCYYKSAVDVYSMDMAVSPTMYCLGSTYYLAQIQRDATTSAITVFVQQYSSGNYMNLTLTNNTCTAWQTGLESGQYCTPIGMTTTPGVLVFGSYIYFPAQNGAFVANYSILPGTTNVSFTAGQIYGFVTSGSSTVPGDVYINTMGTAANPTNLWVSSYGALYTGSQPWSIAASRNACPWAWTMNLTDNIALASAPLPAAPFGGMRVMAVFHYMGNFTMLLPGNSTSVNQRCYIYGTYQVVPGPAPQQVSFQTTGMSQACTYPFEISSGQWSGTTAAPVVSFSLWYGWNSTENVTVSTTDCGNSGTIQPGRYCDGQGFFVYTCNGDVLSFAAPSSVPVSYGNVTLNTNGSMTFWEQADPMATLLQYNMTSRTVWSSQWYSQGVGYMSADMCALPPMAQDLAMPTVGMYCGSGSIAGTNATAFVLPNGNLYMTLFTLQPNSSSYNSGMCEIIGNLAWSKSTGYAQYSAMYQSTNCRFGTYYDSAPRVRINATWYNNASGVLTLRGSTWTGPGGEGMDLTYTLSAGSSCVSLGQSSNASLVYYPRGVYGVNAAGLNVTTLVLGTTYAMYGVNAYASSPVGVLGGKYVPGTLSAARSSAGLMPTFTNPQFQTTVTNSTFMPGYLQVSPRWAYSSNSQGGHLALPLGYWGLDPASGGSATPPGPNGPGTNGNAPGDDDKKNNTPIIVGVIVAVVVVVAIIAVIAMRMKSSGGAPKKEADHYTSMNAV